MSLTQRIKARIAIAYTALKSIGSTIAKNWQALGAIGPICAGFIGGLAVTLFL